MNANIEDFLPILVVVVGIISWIVNSILAAKKQNEVQARLRIGPRAEQPVGGRAKKVDAETERFLEEIKRRRRLAVEREQPKPPKPVERPPLEKKAPPVARTPARPVVATRQAPGAKQLGKLAPAPAPALVVPAASAPPAVANLHAVNVAPVVNTFNSRVPSAALKQISGLLRSPASLQTAFVLREVFDRPRSRRRRGRGRASVL